MPLHETLERVRASKPPEGEENAKIKILTPVLQDLGWDVYGTEVVFEYSAGGKSRGGRVDIALMNPKAQSSCVAFVEAKAPRANLNDHVEQVLGYAFHDGVTVCVLTNGEEWWLYLPLEKGPPQDRRFAELRLLNDPIEQLVDDFQTFLGKEVLCNGEAERRAEQVLKARRRASQLNIELPRIWQQMKDEPDSELIELVGKRVYKAIGLRPEPSQVADVLAGAPVRPAPTVPASAPTASVPTPTAARADAGRRAKMTAAEKAEAKKIANEKYRKKFPPLGLWVAPEVVERIPAAFPGSTRREVLNTALHRWGHLAENRQLPRPPYLTPRTKKKKPAEEEPAGEGRAGEEPAKKGRVTWEVRVSGRVKRRIDEIADEIEWRPALVARALVERELEDAERRTRDAEPPENAGAAESGAGAARGGAPDGRARWRVSR